VELIPSGYGDMVTLRLRPSLSWDWSDPMHTHSSKPAPLPAPTPTHMVFKTEKPRVTPTSCFAAICDNLGGSSGKISTTLAELQQLVGTFLNRYHPNVHINKMRHQALQLELLHAFACSHQPYCSLIYIFRSHLHLNKNLAILPDLDNYPALLLIIIGAYQENCNRD
jgi:hypothetical protein